MNALRTIVAAFQLILSLGVVAIIQTNETLALMFYEWDLFAFGVLTLTISVCLFFIITNENKTKLSKRFPEYFNPPPPPSELIKFQDRVVRKYEGYKPENDIDTSNHPRFSNVNKIITKQVNPSTMATFNSVSLAECAAIEMIKSEKLQKTRYIYMCSGGKVIILSHMISDVNPIIIVKPE